MRIIKILLLGFVILIPYQSYGQITITGKVVDKHDKFFLPGVSIIEKGTENGTTTDIDGNFTIEVNDKSSILVLSYIGYKTKEISVKDTDLVEIEIEVYCILDYFDYNDIWIGASSGVLNSPIGGYAGFTYPFVNISTLFGEIDYQSNFSNNSKLIASAGLRHILAECYLQGDLSLDYRLINVNDFKMDNYSIEGKLFFSRPRLLTNNSYIFLGYGLSNISNKDLDYSNNSGFTFGYGTMITRPLYLDIYIKSTYWKTYWEFKTGLERHFKALVVGVDYNMIDSYREINLKLGYIFNY